MSIDKVRDYLKQFGKEKDILIMNESTATVKLAAQALKTKEARIAKSLAFKNDDRVILIVVAGDVRIDNKKFKEEFGIKAKMLLPEETLLYVGHSVGGVCPFAVKDCVDVFLDDSMKRFDTVFPACGSSNSAIELTMDELKIYSKSIKWVNICKYVDNN